MPLLDPKTLSFAVGLGNLVFALLATLYIAKTRTRHPALEIWRWGRLVSGSAFLTNLASSAAPELVPGIVGNLLHTLAGVCDVAAYCLLLERQRWQRALAWLGGLSLAALLLLAWLELARSWQLLAFSAIGVVFYLLLAFLLLKASRGDWLLRLIGAIDLLLALVLLLRVGRGLAFAPLVRFDTDVITLLLYLTLYLVATVNGFGFLLLVKQKDDKSLYRALDKLEAADEARHEFLARASHEFRTPAALIKASLDSLRFVEPELPAAVTQRLENIRLATRRLTDLSNTLLTHDRVSQPSMLFQPVRLDVVAALAEALQLYPPEARLQAELPVAPRYLQADPTQLRIAVQNLVDNALEHNPPDSGPVRVYLQEAGTRLEICVADCGSGIADGDKDQIFRRFYSLHGNFTRGVGLSIVHNIARNHGGDAWARDNRPRGTLMVLSLPGAAGEAA